MSEKIFQIEVKEKIARLVNCDEFLVCGNSDYEVHFEFDDAWKEYPAKTALFVFGNTTIEKPFYGNVCEGVLVEGATRCYVGVFSGDLVTTTKAEIKCLQSIRDIAKAPKQPTPDKYNEIIDLINGLVFEAGVPYDEIPEMNGKGNPGKSKFLSRGDHVHPTDETRASAKKVEKLETDLEAEIGRATEAENYLNGFIARQSLTLAQSIVDEKNRAIGEETRLEARIDTTERIAKGANQAISYINYGKMVDALNELDANALNIGQSILIDTLGVPDLWVSNISTQYEKYGYTSDEAIANVITEEKRVQVGYYELSALETQKVDLTDYAKNEAVEAVKQTIDLAVDIARNAEKTAVEMKDEVAESIAPELEKISESVNKKQDQLAFDETYNPENNKVATVATVARKIAEIIANAPEDFDTLKELADWLDTHGKEAAEMNTAIADNTKAIEELDGKIDNVATEVENNILPHIVNADYDENDRNKKSHILHRPFYQESEEKTLEKTPESPVFRQDVSGSFTDYNLYYRVSDEPIDKEDLIGAVLYGSFSHDGSDGSYSNELEETITEENIVEGNGGISAIGVYIVTDYDAYANDTDIPFDSNGVYLIKTYSEGGSYSETTEYTKIVYKDITVHKLDNKYLDLPSNPDFNALEDEVEVVESIAKGANRGVVFDTFLEVIDTLNFLPNDVYNVGQNILIRKLNVPDLWVSGIVGEGENRAYIYLDDNEWREELTRNGYVLVGYYRLSELETQKVDLSNYVKNTDYATSNKAGLIKATTYHGLKIGAGGDAEILGAGYSEIDAKKQFYQPITPLTLDYAIKVGLTTNTETLTAEEKAKAFDWLGTEEMLDFFFTNGTIGLKYSINDTIATCLGVGEATETDIEIASMVRGIPVLVISAGAFYGCSSLTSVVIPDSVTTIHSSAFRECGNLKSVTIGNGVTSIEDHAFRDCDGLTDVYYSGTEEEWNAITISAWNESLTTATIHFESEV